MKRLTKIMLVGLFLSFFFTSSAQISSKSQTVAVAKDGPGDKGNGSGKPK
jgi:hypothetical protein